MTVVTNVVCNGDGTITVTSYRCLGHNGNFNLSRPMPLRAQPIHAIVVVFRSGGLTTVTAYHCED